MSETGQDAMGAGAILLGAAMQRMLGGPWLLVTGCVAMALRIAHFQEERRGVLATAGGCALWCPAGGEPVLVDNLASDPRFGAALMPFRSAVVLPMVVRDEPVGTLIG